MGKALPTDQEVTLRIHAYNECSTYTYSYTFSGILWAVVC